MIAGGATAGVMRDLGSLAKKEKMAVKTVSRTIDGIPGGAMTGRGSPGGKEKMALKTDDRMIEGRIAQMDPIIALRGIMPPAQNNREISLNVGPTNVRQKASAIAAKTEVRKGPRPLTAPDKEEIPVGGATVAADDRIMEALGQAETIRKKAISSE